MEDETPTRGAHKICAVCGDRALGYNFNAISCESCKAFFRRNALKNKDFRCPFTENCKVTPVTRRFCQKCRLDKCFNVGMRKEYIMTEHDKELKRKKIEQNRAKKRPTSDTSKPLKMKREQVEESNYEDTAGSVASVASAETYFWESDRKYTDLDGKGSSTIESLSPVTAASVPSPSSPESRDIIGSKTLEMLKESPHASNLQFPKSPSLAVDNIYDSPHEIQIHEEDLQNYPESPSELISEPSFSPQSNHNASSTSSEAPNNCQTSRRSCSNTSEIIDKLQNPSFIFKLMKSPHLIMEIFQDKALLSQLASNAKIAALIADADRELTPETSIQGLANNGVSDDLIRDMLEADQSPGENPILTNLIGESKDPGDEEGIEQASSTSADIDRDVDKETDDVTRDVMQDVERTSIGNNSIESILCEAIKLEFSAYSCLGSNQSNRELNDAERAKLNELIVANKALLAPLDDDLTNFLGEECTINENSGQPTGMLLDLINLTAIAIKRLIKMAKKINAFKNMCQEDQLALLKGGCTEMLILRSAITYDPEKDLWKIPHSQESKSIIKTDVLKQAKGNIYAEHARFVKDFDPKWRDENIILILSAIALFTPDRPRVVHNDVIKLEQNSYYYLLRRYLESIYPGCESKSMFLRLIRKISDLHRLNKEVVGVYLNVNPSSVEPLLIEIFDLKS
ncbi:nuclear hormone receptor HR96 [Fopius arisanus]|uniref:Nuclear hormone receptor HR96 n=1 Tax=Fopius arisanus TaxID=64838 RepID=A0A9R1TJ17_9HYME|nr:PREDICTED: nuclear hormone receptor HR96 [Fopius arisanus]XP_011310310.1 PREDICTED: nuclear hormone receptor HR96 [Fopius arisanus]